jgi:hypothetical protein
MGRDGASYLSRRLGWTEVELVEGSGAVLWAVDGGSVDPAGELPDQSAGVRAVLSSVTPNVVGLKTGTSDLPTGTLLVSTVAVGGAARFVVQNARVVGSALVCDPPSDVHVVERRDLFRVPAAAPVTVSSPFGTWSLYTMDCSLGGLCVCPPVPLEIDTEVDVELQLAPTAVSLHAVVRYSQPFGEGEVGVPGRDGCPSVTGLQFLDVPSEVERRLSALVGRNQRRLMPRVQGVVPVDYRSQGRRYFMETRARELSPGDLVMVVYHQHVPGERMQLRLRLSRQDFDFQACVITCHATGREGRSPLYAVRVVIHHTDDAVEARFRRAVRDMAVERVGREYAD